MLCQALCQHILATLCQQFLSIHVIPCASLCSSFLGRDLLRLCKRCCVLSIHVEACIGTHGVCMATISSITG